MDNGRIDSGDQHSDYAMSTVLVSQTLPSASDETGHTEVFYRGQHQNTNKTSLEFWKGLTLLRALDPLSVSFLSKALL